MKLLVLIGAAVVIMLVAIGVSYLVNNITLTKGKRR